MADIGIQVSTNYETKSVFINPKIKPKDGYKVIKDADGNVTGVEENTVSNIISEGSNRAQVIKQVYGSKLGHKHNRN